jgi:hypothetical protein
MTAYAVYKDSEYWTDDLSIAVEDAIQDIEPEGGFVMVIYEADKVHYKINDFFSADSLVDTMLENAYDEKGEITECWDIPFEKEKILIDRIEKLVEEWANEHDLQPNFYGVKNKREKKINVLTDGGWEEA